MDAAEAARNALECVLDAKKGESLVIFSDEAKKGVGEAFEKGAQELKLQAKLVLLSSEPRVFRKEIPQQLVKFLTAQRPNIYINLLRGLSEETPFRIKLIQMETRDKKTRLGHCPGVTEDMLTKGALALTVNEHLQMQTLAERLIRKLQTAAKVRITNPAGTEISLNVKERPFFTDAKFNWKLMKWLNLPTGEVMVAPVENSLEGKLVCDMAIGGISPIRSPVTIVAKDGKVQNVSSANAGVLRKVRLSLGTDEMASVVGEFAFGVNAKARFVEEFLESEKILGTVHIAFGNNSDMPKGKNNSANHMDFLLAKPTVDIITEDGGSFTILKDGVFRDL
ncbi:MAG: aminopeptidase [Candidatus Bathyarchaeota archaeon]|nr:aminopeptidase [Candidatus Bathyarchaeota archaeon]